MSDKPPEASGPIANPYISAVLAWLLPGAGHFYLGRRGRALVFFLIIVTAVVLGANLHGHLYRLEGGQPLSLLGGLGAMGMGLPYFVLTWVFGYHGNVEALGYEYGTAFLLSAGLMNLLLVLNAWDIALGREH